MGWPGLRSCSPAIPSRSERANNDPNEAPHLTDCTNATIVYTLARTYSGA
jgi:hypothetical protein